MYITGHQGFSALQIHSPFQLLLTFVLFKLFFMHEEANTGKYFILQHLQAVLYKPA